MTPGPTASHGGRQAKSGITSSREHDCDNNAVRETPAGASEVADIPIKHPRKFMTPKSSITLAKMYTDDVKTYLEKSPTDLMAGEIRLDPGGLEPKDLESDSESFENGVSIARQPLRLRWQQRCAFSS